MPKENFFVKQEEEITTENQPIDSEKTEDNLEIGEEEERKRNLQNVAGYHFGLVKIPFEKNKESPTIQEANPEGNLKHQKDNEEIEKIRKSIGNEPPEQKVIANEILPNPEKAEEEDNENGRYLFYTDRYTGFKKEKNLSQDRIVEIKKIAAGYKNLPAKEELGIKDDPKFIGMINEVKDEITDFTEKIGIDIKDYLPKNENIYELADKTFDKYGNKKFAASSYGNELLMRKKNSKERKRFSSRHEIIHLISKQKLKLQKDQSENADFQEIAMGYTVAFKKYLLYFNEGLTQLTNLQIAKEYENIKDYKNWVGYENQVIFISELAADLAKKLNQNPEKAGVVKNSLDIKNKELTQKDIITYLQKGMFEGNMKTLKIISDIYDNKPTNFNALKTIANMKLKNQDMLEIAEAFGLTEAVKKIEQCSEKLETEINIADTKIKFYKQSPKDKLLTFLRKNL